MSYWIELHCDVLSDGPKDPGRLDAFCFTNRNDNVMAGAKNSRGSTLHTIRYLEKRARLQGWKKTRKGWACPNCKTLKEPGE